MLARRLGFAARFVTGYIHDRSPESEAMVSVAGLTHAWADVFIPNDGWVEFDPTNGIVGSRDLVRVAVARDPHQALPLHGTYLGPADAYLGMDVTIHVLSVGEEGSAC